MESRVARNVADALAVRLTRAEQKTVARAPTANPAAYDAYLRGLEATSHPTFHTTEILAAQQHFEEATRLDPEFALAWAQLSLTDSWGYYSGWVDATPALREAARVAADNALRLQPRLGEALLATGCYHAYCLADPGIALTFYDRARPLLPNSSYLPQLLADLHADAGDFDAAGRDYSEALRLDPRNVRLLSRHALLLVSARRYADALRGYDALLAVAPGAPDALNNKAGVLTGTGDLAGAAAILNHLHPGPNDGEITYNQMILAWMQRRPERAVALLKNVAAHRAEIKATSAAGWLAMLGTSLKLAGDPAAAAVALHDARRELEILLATQPDNPYLTTDVARCCAAMGDHDAALAAARRAVALRPVANNQNVGRAMLDILAEVAAQVNEPDLAIQTLQSLRHAQYEGAMVGNCPVNAAILRLYPMFDPLRNDPRFQALCREDD